MTPGPIYLALGLALLGGSWLSRGWAGQIACLYAALPCLALGAAYFMRRPGIFLKRPDGRLPLVSYLLFGAYQAASLLVLTCHRAFARKEPWHEIVPGLYVGAQPGWKDEARWGSLLAGRPLYVLDLTAEMSEPAWIRRSARYLSLRTLDRTAPAVGEVAKGVAFIQEGLSTGIVLVHCAFGHSRSALCAAAYLAASGRCRTVEEAWALVRSKRPGAYLNRAQQLCLDRVAQSAAQTAAC